MKRLFSMAILFCAMTIASFASVAVSSPTKGATVQSPVEFVASATSKSPITEMVIYVDTKDVYTTDSASLNTNIPMSSGKHAIVVEAVDSSGRSYSSALTLVVQPAVSTTPVTVAPVTLPVVAAQMADSFVDSVGVNVHFSYYGTVYTTQLQQMLTNISTLGVRHLRDQMAWQGASPGAPFYSVHNSLGAMGVKTDYILTSIDYPMSQVQAYPTLVDDMEAVEASNEYDASGDSNWVQNILAQQSALYSQIHETPSTQGISVLSPSLAQPQNASQLGAISDISDAGNSHAYFAGWNPGNSGTGGANNPAYFMALALVNAPAEPIWVTESGYWSEPGPYFGGGGISEAAQAIYSPRLMLEFWNAGARRTYEYQLADDSSDTYFGLLRSDGSVRPAFGAMANLLGLLSDPGATFQPAGLAYSLSGGNSQLHHALFQKRDGSYYLALWIEALSYDFTNSVLLTVPLQQVSLQLGSPVASAAAYQWDDAGNVTTTSIPAGQTMTINVTDKLQIIKLVL